MNKGFLFTGANGFPINQDRLEWMQKAYTETFGGLAAMIGDNAIVSGCIVAGANVSDGWVVIGGELLPFVASASQATIVIVETKMPLTFKDGTNKNVQFSRVVKFGTGAGSIQWSGMTRLSSIKDVSNHIALKNNPHAVTKAQVGLSNIPNSKTDDISVSNSEILATSKMVNSVNYAERLASNKKLLMLFVTVPVPIGSTAFEETYPLPASLPKNGTDYFVLAHANNAQDFNIGASLDSNASNVIVYGVRDASLSSKGRSMVVHLLIFDNDFDWV